MILTTGDGVQVSDCLVDCSRGPNRASVDANFSEIQSCIYMHAVGYVSQCMANPSRTIDIDRIVAAQYLASLVAFAGTKFGVLRQWQRDLCPLRTMYNQQLALLLSPQKRNTPLSAARCDAEAT